MFSLNSQICLCSVIFTARQRNGFITAIVMLATVLAGASAQAVNQTWDTSTTAGIQPGNGTWGTDNFWTTNGTTLGAFTTGSTATFAGADGTYSIGLSGSPSAASVNFINSGYNISSTSPQTLTLTINNSTGGTASAANSAIWVAAGVTATVGSNVYVPLTATSFGQRIGIDSSGILNIGAGARLDKSAGANRDLVFGSATVAGTGTLNVSGSITRSVASDTGEIVIGNGTGTVAVNVNNGGVINTLGTGASNGNGSIAISNFNGATGVLNINAGGTVTAGDATLTDANAGVKVGALSGGTGVVNLSGGTLTTQKVFMVSGANGTFNFNGGLLVANTSTTSFMTGLTAANVLASGGSINTNGFNVTIAQSLLDGTSGGGSTGLTKSGNGALTLTGANNSYLGPTSVNAGALIVNDSPSGGGNYTVQSGATLAGTGTIASGTVTIGSGGGLAPGINVSLTSGSIGTLNLPNLSLSNADTAYFGLGPTNTPGGTSNGLVVVTGNLSLTGTTAIGINTAGATLANANYTLFTYTGTPLTVSQSGQFSLATPGAEQPATLSI